MRQRHWHVTTCLMAAQFTLASPWIGWMNNWETNDLPTHPWRGAMSIPRVLSLRQGENGLFMVQQPIEELSALRFHRTQIP